MSYASSWVVIWALTLAPMAMVSALRETSIAFAVAIGILFLNEPVNLKRMASIEFANPAMLATYEPSILAEKLSEMP